MDLPLFPPANRLAITLRKAKHPHDHTSALALYYRECGQEVVDLCQARKIELGCFSGCSHCCYQRVTVAPHEVFVISDHVQRRFSAAERAALIERLKAHQGIIRELSFEERALRNIACPFLVGGKCNIYPVRPMVCQGVQSLCSLSCQRYFSSPGVAKKPPASPHLFDLWEKMGALGDYCFRTAGYDMAEHDLPFAVASALVNPLHHKRWRQKKAPLLDGKIPGGRS